MKTPTALEACRLAVNILDSDGKNPFSTIATTCRKAIKNAEADNTELLRQLNIILNAYQDIEDALNSGDMPDPKRAIKKANDRIGKAVTKLLPG